MVQHELFNRKNKIQLLKDLQEESYNRKTCSFYRYVKITEPQSLRDQLYIDWNKLGVLGRIYLAKEGINAQVSIPEPHWELFKIKLQTYPKFQNILIKIAVEDDNQSFLKLIIRVKNKIVADGLNDETFDSSNAGNHLTAAEFNAAMDKPNAIVVDMRNYYESEVGHFENAICPEAETFKEALPEVKDKLSGQEDLKILLYCTGGIRCEKASAYLKYHNFNDVNQLYGGIIEYSHQVKEENLHSKFIGKNFVFDSRMGEEITGDIISHCHQCDAPSHQHTNCRNQACHILFIQCKDCEEKYIGCCSVECSEIADLGIEKQKILRKDPSKAAPLKQFQKGVKPRLKELIREREKANQQT